MGPVQYQVVDTQNMNVPIAQPQSAANRTGFKLLNYFPSFHPFSNKPVIDGKIGRHSGASFMCSAIHM